MNAIVTARPMLPARSRKITTGGWLTAWLYSKEVRANTQRSYGHHVHRYLIPQLGEVCLAELNSGHVACCYNAIMANPDRPGQTGTMTAATLRRVHATLRSALNAAVRAGLIDRNPALYVDLPDARRPKVRPWEPAELGAFLDSVAGDPFGPIFALVAGSGACRGEALGLRWADVDLGQSRAVARRQLLQLDGDQSPCPYCGTAHPGAVFGPPRKSASGEDRIIDLDALVVRILTEHRSRQDIHRAEWGEAYNDHGLVFAREDGTPILPERVTKRFAALVAEAGLRHIRLHDLRHGWAALLLATGTDVPLVSRLLGHSSVSVTAQTYEHLTTSRARAERGLSVEGPRVASTLTATGAVR